MICRAASRWVAAEFNRYNRTPRLVIEDQVAAQTTLSGVFDADDPESLLLFLSGVPTLSTENRGDDECGRTAAAQ